MRCRARGKHPQLLEHMPGPEKEGRLFSEHEVGGLNWVDFSNHVMERPQNLPTRVLGIPLLSSDNV